MPLRVGVFGLVDKFLYTMSSLQSLQHLLAELTEMYLM